MFVSYYFNMDNRKENTTVKYVLTMGIENDTMIKIAKQDNHRRRLKSGYMNEKKKRVPR